MRSGVFKAAFFFGFGVFLLIAGHSVRAEGLAADKLEAALEEIKIRLTAIEKKQDEISQKEDSILKELDRLRVWVRRN